MPSRPNVVIQFVTGIILFSRSAVAVEGCSDNEHEYLAFLIVFLALFVLAGIMLCITAKQALKYYNRALALQEVLLEREKAVEQLAMDHLSGGGGSSDVGGGGPDASGGGPSNKENTSFHSSSIGNGVYPFSNSPTTSAPRIPKTFTDSREKQQQDPLHRSGITPVLLNLHQEPSAGAVFRQDTVGSSFSFGPLRQHQGSSTYSLAFKRTTMMSHKRVQKIVHQLRQGLWQKGRMLGNGSTGTVYLCILNDGSFVAMKQLDMTGASSEEAHGLVEELQLMAKLRSEHIIRYFHANFEDSTKMIHLFMEYVHGGPLSTLIQRLDGKLQESVARRYVRQIVKGLAFLHEHHVIHRDIKGDNILIESEGLVKLADFGSAKMLKTLGGANNNGPSTSSIKYATTLQPTHTIIGTPLWMAPEVVNPDAPGGDHADNVRMTSTDTFNDADFLEGDTGSKGGSNGRLEKDCSGYTTRADIWSLGICVGELLNQGKPPWPTFNSAWEAMYHIGSLTKPPEIPEASSTCMDFMRQCLQLNPRDRPSARVLLNHPWLLEVDGDGEEYFFDEEDDSSFEFREAIEQLRKHGVLSRDSSGGTILSPDSGGIFPLHALPSTVIPASHEGDVAAEVPRSEFIGAKLGETGILARRHHPSHLTPVLKPPAAEAGHRRGVSIDSGFGSSIGLNKGPPELSATGQRSLSANEMMDDLLQESNRSPSSKSQMTATLSSHSFVRDAVEEDQPLQVCS